MKERIDGNTIRKIRNWMKDGREAKVYDTESAGLAIRTYKGGRASWCVMTRDWQGAIGELSLFTADDVPALREMVARARRMKAEGRDHLAFIQEFVRRRDIAEAGNRADVSSGLAASWEHARDAFLQWIKDYRSADTYRGYRSSLGAVPGGALEADFKPMHGKPLASVTLADMVVVRENIVRRGRAAGSATSNVRQANLTVSVLCSFWAWQMNRDGNLITSNPSAELGKAKERNVTAKAAGSAAAQRSMLQDEIGLVIWGLENYPNAQAQTGTMLQLLTGQRRMTVAQARKESFYEHSEFGMVWRLEDKTHSWRVIPLPAAAQASVETARLMARADSPFLFPQQRERRVGSGGDGHINERTFSDVLETMREPDGPLHGLPFRASTHKLRKAFISTMAATMHKYRIGDRVLESKDIAIITHANEGRDTTATMVYDQNPYLPIKMHVLQEWEQWCLEGYYRIKAEREAAAA